VQRRIQTIPSLIAALVACGLLASNIQSKSVNRREETSLRLAFSISEILRESGHTPDAVSVKRRLFRKSWWSGFRYSVIVEGAVASDEVLDGLLTDITNVCKRETLAELVVGSGSGPVISGRVYVRVFVTASPSIGHKVGDRI
jgi:hypothetical protein